MLKQQSTEPSRPVGYPEKISAPDADSPRPGHSSPTIPSSNASGYAGSVKDAPSEKVCIGCGQLKALDQYYINKARSPNPKPNGKCKACVSLQQKAWKANNRDRQKITQKAYYLRNKKKPEAIARRMNNRSVWQKANPEVAHAHAEVARARKRGDLVMGPCAICGSPPIENAGRGKQVIIAFHEDYSRPLEVTWLCQKHAALRREEKLLKGVD